MSKKFEELFLKANVTSHKLPIIDFGAEGNQIRFQADFAYEKPDEIEDHLLTYAYEIRPLDQTSLFKPGEIIIISEDDEIIEGDMILVVQKDVITGKKHVIIGKCVQISITGLDFNLMLETSMFEETIELSSTDLSFTAKILPYFAQTIMGQA